MKTEKRGGKLFLILDSRIDTGNASEFEREASDALAENRGLEPVFDAAALEYVSSVGLRVLLKLRNKVGHPLDMENVSPDVYEILEMTGFTTLLNVRKRLREISVDGCELLGQGANGAAYRLNEDTIVKVYKPGIGFEDVDRERNLAKTAFIYGIPCAMAYDTVRVGDCLGVVFEMLKADTLGHAIARCPEKMEAYANQYVALAKKLHHTKVPKGAFPDMRDILRSRIPPLQRWCSRGELNLLENLVNGIPERDTLIHNDLHPGKIMIQDGELILIDLQQLVVGQSLFDLVAIYRDMVFAPRMGSEVMERSVGLPSKLMMKVGDMFFRKYAVIVNDGMLEDYYRNLHLLYALDVTLMVGAGLQDDAQRSQIVIEKLFRGVVVPHANKIRYLLSHNM